MRARRWISMVLVLTALHAPRPATAAPPDALPQAPALLIDAGPKANARLDVSTLPELTGPDAAEVCRLQRDTRQSLWTVEWRCGVRLLAVPAGGLGAIRRAALVVAHPTEWPPGYTELLSVAIESPNGWKLAVPKLGTTYVHAAGHPQWESWIIGAGVIDLGVHGGWVWVDAMMDDSAWDVDVWTRVLWLCGGSDPGPCRQVPLKSWSTGGFDGLTKVTDSRVRSSMHALAVALGADGTAVVTAKTRVPKSIEPLLGRHPIESLGLAP